MRTLADIDRDGALEEAVGGLCGTTRAGLLRGAAFGGAALLAALAAPAALAAGADDTKGLNYLLAFERLQASFYTQAYELGTVARLKPAAQTWAETLGAHERAHVRILKDVLGSKAQGRPTFDFGGATETPAAFTKTAVAFEDLTTALLTGVAPRLHDRGLTAALFGLLTVEARHAAWARSIVGTTPAPNAQDEPRTLASVQGTIDRTHFVTRAPRTTGRGTPSFTG